MTWFDDGGNTPPHEPHATGSRAAKGDLASRIDSQLPKKVAPNADLYVEAADGGPHATPDRAAKYRTIVADPPWDIGKRGSYSWREGRASGSVRPLDYPTMTLEQITELPVGDLAADTAHLFMWTTQRHLGPAFDIVKAWGFRYVCTLAWCKEPHGWGPGGIFQSTLEHCLYATRGSVGRSAQIDRQWWTWPRGAHSAKPEAFLDMVEGHFPAPRLEMFARRNRLGWATWGNQSLEHVDLRGQSEDTDPLQTRSGSQSV